MAWTRASDVTPVTGRHGSCSSTGQEDLSGVADKAGRDAGKELSIHEGHARHDGQKGEKAANLDPSREAATLRVSAKLVQT